MMTQAVRRWRRQPLLALAAMASLALGIGANTAIFTVLDAVVLRPLPFPGADRLVAVWETSPDNPARWVAPANFLDWRRQTRAFSGLSAFDEFSVALTGRGEPERLRAGGASGNFFQTLGITAALGRTLLPSDDEPGAEPVVVLTDGLWQRLFGGRASALGEVLTIEGRPHTVIGVLPPGFTMPMAPTVEAWLGSDRGIPRSFPFPGDITTVRDSHLLSVVGRLEAGVSRERAGDELARIMDQLARTYPDTNEGLGVALFDLHEQVVGPVRRLVVMLQLAVGVLLVIACANVANLILGQLASRRAELATRAALGADRRHLVRQLLAETLVVAVPGGALGLLLAAWGVDALVGLAPTELPRLSEVAIDGRVLAFTAVCTVATALVFGLGPALRSSRSTDVARPDARIVGEGSVRFWHGVMTVGELALAQVLLVASGLLVGSLLAAQQVDLGFTPADRVAADLSLPADRYLQPKAGGSPDDFRVNAEPKRQLVAAVLERMRGMPGVRVAAASFTSPLGGAPNRGVRIEGAPMRPDGQEPSADFQVVTPDFFRALGIRMLEGRVFDDGDRGDSLPVAIVNRTFVDRVMGGVNPMGRVLVFGGSTRHEIVGVVDDARYRDVERAADATFYVPLSQNDERWPFLSFTVWYDRDQAGSSAGSIAGALRDAVRAADPDLPVSRVRSYDEILSAALAPRRFNTWLISLFAATAVLLAAIGAYGVLAYAVTSRARELGVRAALGAGPARLRRLVVGQGLQMAGAAVVLGMSLAWLASRTMASLLFEVQPRDPGIFVTVAGVLLVVALVAAWLPARRATRLDPVTVLREG